jgi:2-iminobutanoate/2-iminopropanoate deaminase
MTRGYIFCSGQLPADAEGNLVEGSIGEKTKACINALAAILEKAGSGLHRIIKVQIFLTDMADFVEMNQEYEKWITHKPARSCICVKALPRGVNIEIECEALKRSKPRTAEELQVESNKRAAKAQKHRLARERPLSFL